MITESLPIFMQFLKQNLMFYSVLVSGSMDTTLLRNVEYYQLSDQAVEIRNLTFQDKMRFPTVHIQYSSEQVVCTFWVEDDRFLLRTKEYFGKDSFMRVEGDNEEAIDESSLVKSKKIYFPENDPPVRVWIKYSVMTGHVVTIQAIEPNQPFTPIQKASSVQLSKMFEAAGIGQSDYYKKNVYRAVLKAQFALMEIYEELKNRQQLHLLKDLLPHEHDNVRRWAASCLLVLDEKLALRQLKEIGQLSTYEGEKAREVVKDWESGVSDFIF